MHGTIRGTSVSSAHVAPGDACTSKPSSIRRAPVDGALVEQVVDWVVERLG
jgi:hypothetical protein